MNNNGYSLFLSTLTHTKHKFLFLWQSLWQCVNSRDTYKLYGTFMVGTVLFSSSIFPPKINRNVPGLRCSSRFCAEPCTVHFVYNTTLMPRRKSRRYTAQSQLNHCESPENYSDLVRSLQAYVKDTGLWIEEIKLKLNNDKTEAVCFSPASSVNTAMQHSQTISLSNSNIEFDGIVRNLGFIFDNDLSIKQHCHQNM